MNPKNTVFDAKRLIGRKFDDNKLQADMKHWPFVVVNDGGKPKIQVEYKGEIKKFAPEEVSITFTNNKQRTFDQRRPWTFDLSTKRLIQSTLSTDQTFHHSP